MGLWLASGTMVFILGYCLWAMVWYARGHAMESVMAFCMGVLFRFLLPAATVLMFLGLGYPAMQDATAASALSGFAAKLNSIAPPMGSVAQTLPPELLASGHE